MFLVFRVEQVRLDKKIIVKLLFYIANVSHESASNRTQRAQLQRLQSGVFVYAWWAVSGWCAAAALVQRNWIFEK